MSFGQSDGLKKAVKSGNFNVLKNIYLVFANSIAREQMKEDRYIEQTLMLLHRSSHCNA